jgi:hypothetical protein
MRLNKASEPGSMTLTIGSGERHSAFGVSADSLQRNELAKHEPLVEVVPLQLEKPGNNTLNRVQIAGRRYEAGFLPVVLLRLQ